MIKKVSAIGLSLTTAVWLSGAIMVLPVAASAATVGELQAQIASLLAQIQALQAQLTQTGSGAPSYNYTRDLTVGSKGDDVTALQNFLKSQSSAQWPAGQAATGYFGNTTKSALAKYQAAVGLSPAVGYFGPKTRAYVASLAAGGGTTGGGVAIPATGVSVGLASDNPAAGSLISGSLSAATRVEVLKVVVAAGTSGAAKVTGIKFTKTGVLSDTAVAGAYLVESGSVVAQYSSVSGGVVTFSGLSLNLDAGRSRTFALAIDPSTGLTAGNTVGFSVKAAADVTVTDSAGTAVTPSGNFPMNGNTFTVTNVSNPSLASITIASSSIGTTVYAGTTNVLVSQWTLTVTNNPVKLASLKFRVVGSAAKSDLQNIKLYVNGSQIGSTLAKVDDDGSAYFNLTASPAVVAAGSGNMQVYADVMGSPSFNFDFGILNSYDVLAIDTQYNSGVSVTINGGGTGTSSGHLITINQGQITVTAASNTPTGNIAKGGSGITLAKFSIYAAGEPVKVKYLDTWLVLGGTNTNGSSTLQNLYLVDDQGVQVGSTINTMAAGSGSGQCADSQSGTTLTTTANIYCHFGSSASPINYVIPANTTRTISLKVNILSSLSGITSITGKLPTMSGGNLQGLTSSQTSNSGSASGAALSIATTPLTAAVNSAFGNQNYAKGSTVVKIGSYTLTGSAAEGVNISNLTITLASSNITSNFQSLLVKVGSTQFGTTKATLSNSDAVTFSGSSPIVVPAGGSATVDVYADILTGASAVTATNATTLTSCVGTGATTFSSVSCSPASLAGQNVTIAGTPGFAVALSSASALAKQVVMGSNGNSLATFRLTDNQNVEAMKIQTLVVTASSTDASATKPSFSSVYLYGGGALVSGPVSASSTVAGAWLYTFNPGTQPVIPQNGSLELEVKGDVATYNSQGAQSNKAYVFKIASTTSDITALGLSSNANATTTSAAAVGNAITVLRGKLTLSSTIYGGTTNRVRSALDTVANMTFTPDSTGYDVTINSVTLKFQGQAVSSGVAAFNVDLLDGGTNWSGSTTQSCNPTTGNSCSVTFTFTTSTPTISASTPKTVQLRVNSSSFYNGTQTSDSLSVTVNSVGDIGWGDGSTTAGLTLQATDVPKDIATISYE